MQKIRFYLASALMPVLLFLILQGLYAPETDRAAERQKYSEIAEPTAAGKSAVTWMEVKRIIDGDTIVVNINGRSEKVRLIGVDAPEINQQQQSADRFGQEAAKYLQQMLDGRIVRLSFDTSSKDRYGRHLAYVYTDGGRFINFEMVKAGYAKAMTVPPNVKYKALFLSQEKIAREKREGLWEDLQFRIENQPDQ